MKNYLLDTPTFLWFLNGDEQLSKKARLSIEDQKSTKFISIASIWEIAIKLSLGKLELGISLAELKNEILLFSIIKIKLNLIAEANNSISPRNY